MRAVLVATALFIVVCINAYLLATEQIVQSEAQVWHTQVTEDPLLELQYTRGSRETNLQDFGLPNDLVVRTLDRIRDLEDRDKERIVLMLDDAPEPTELYDAVCGETSQRRPRYGALHFLVEDKAGLRRARPIRRVTSLDEQEWAKLSPIQAIYDHVELAEERQPDATLMGIAGILLGKEEDVLNNYAPWGRGLAGTWSWKRVVKENPSVEERVVEYFALMHLVLELAQDEGGLCRR